MQILTTGVGDEDRLLVRVLSILLTWVDTTNAASEWFNGRAEVYCPKDDLKRGTATPTAGNANSNTIPKGREH
ncbi:unnamed protein product [Sphacelaria rigidula]